MHDRAARDDDVGPIARRKVLERVASVVVERLQEVVLIAHHFARAQQGGALGKEHARAA